MTILDDFSGFGWVLFLKSKKDTYISFIKWFTQVKNIYNTRIKFIRTDNGTEFCNNSFKQFFINNGITHQLTVSYNPQQNGRAKRLHSILINTAKALLNDAKLSHHFWEDALETANYIHNRIPHRGIQNKIPFTILNKSEVDYSNIKVFDCKVFFFIPKQFRTKFENNSSPGIFLDYSDNPSAFKIFDIKNNKIILSLSAIFFENNSADYQFNSSTPLFSNFIPYHEIRVNSSYFNNNSYTPTDNNENNFNQFINTFCNNAINNNQILHHFNNNYHSIIDNNNHLTNNTSDSNNLINKNKNYKKNKNNNINNSTKNKNKNKKIVLIITLIIVSTIIITL